jgi:hypothetical protein
LGLSHASGPEKEQRARTAAQSAPQSWSHAYRLDATQGKKSPVLTDENGAAIADGARMTGVGSESRLTIWVKFPAPPPETQSVSFAVPEMALFEDLPIQTR